METQSPPTTKTNHLVTLPDLCSQPKRTIPLRTIQNRKDNLIMKTQSHLLKRVAFPLAVFSGSLIPLFGEDGPDAPDLDGDGIPNIVDTDIDNDGLPNAVDPNVDGGIALTGPYKGKYIGDHLNNDNPAEDDIDGDDQRDDSLGEIDIDGDGLEDDDDFEKDIDGDGRDDDLPTELDIDGDGRNDDDDKEDDIDGDGFDDDDDENEHDIDGDGLSDDIDEDIDGDDRLNSGDLDDDTDGDGLSNDDPNEDNSDGDSLNDSEDSDDDNDGEYDDDDLDHHPEDDEEEVEVDLAAGPGANSESEGRVKIQNFGTGETEFEIDIKDVPAGDYDIVIDGVSRGILTAEGEGNEAEGEVEFETNPDDEDERLLDFEVFSLPIEIRRDGVVYFSGTIPTPPEGGGSQTGGDLINLGTAPPSIVGLSWVLDDDSPSDRLDFITETTGNEVDLPESTDIDAFTYAYNVANVTEASLVITFAPDRWDEYSLNFDNSSYIVTEYKDGVIDKRDAGILKTG